MCFFLSSFRHTRDYSHAQEQQKRNLPLQDEITFFKNKLYIHNLQKKLRMGTAWSVNKNPQYSNQHSHWNFIKLSLLVSHLASREKTYVSLSSLFVQSSFFFFFALLFLHVKAVYILTLFSIFFFETFLLNHNIKEPI